MSLPSVDDHRFNLWWVSEVGRPPVAGEQTAYRLARSAWQESRSQTQRDLQRHPVSTATRPLLSTARRPRKTGGAE